MDMLEPEHPLRPEVQRARWRPLVHAFAIVCVMAVATTVAVCEVALHRQRSRARLDDFVSGDDLTIANTLRGSYDATPGPITNIGSMQRVEASGGDVNVAIQVNGGSVTIGDATCDAIRLEPGDSLVNSSPKGFDVISVPHAWGHR